MSPTPPALTAAAWQSLVEMLGDVPDTYLDPANGWVDDLDLVEGYRSISQVLACAFELLLEGDTERPRFTLIVSPERKLLGDNPDAIYHWCRIRGDRAYRISGLREEQVYISFTVHGRDPSGGSMERVVADVNDRQLAVDADGRYELYIGPEGTEVPDGATLVIIDDDAVSVLVRHYFLGELSAQNDPHQRPLVHIEPLVDPGPAAPWSDAVLAEKLDAVRDWVRANTAGRPRPDAPSGAPFAGEGPNDIGKPMTFREAGLDAWGAVDIHYATGKFRIEPDEALVMEGTVPPCAFANVMLWNLHMQTLDYRHRTTALNAAQIAYEPDGSYRIVVAHEDPGVANWLDTESHRAGTIFWRFLLAEEQPEQPHTRIVKLADVRAGRI